VLKIEYRSMYKNVKLHTKVNSWIKSESVKIGDTGIAGLAYPNSPRNQKQDGGGYSDAAKQIQKDEDDRMVEGEYEMNVINAELFNIGLISYQYDVLKALKLGGDQFVNVYEQFWMVRSETNYPAIIMDYVHDMTDLDEHLQGKNQIYKKGVFFQVCNGMKQLRDLDLSTDDIEASWGKLTQNGQAQVVFFDVDRCECEITYQETNAVSSFFHALEDKFDVTEDTLIGWAEEWHNGEAAKDDALLAMKCQIDQTYCPYEEDSD